MHDHDKENLTNKEAGRIRRFNKRLVGTTLALAATASAYSAVNSERSEQSRVEMIVIQDVPEATVATALGRYSLRASFLGAEIKESYEAMPEAELKVISDSENTGEPARRIMNQQQVTETLPPPPNPIPNYGNWLRLSICESGGDWAINTGNGYYGGLQFALTSWRGAGGDQYAERPDLATPEEQMLTAEVLLDMQGWNAWPTCSRKLGLR